MEGKDIFVSPGDGLEGKTQGEFIRIGDNSGFTSKIFRSFSSLDFSGDSGDEGELRFTEIDEFLVIFNTSSADEDSGRVDVFELELLKDISSQVFDVLLQSVKRHTESLKSIGGFEQAFVEVSTQLSLQVVGVCVLFNTNLKILY